jgi:RNA polymerase sigma factor (sigma-70 family)
MLPALQVSGSSGGSPDPTDELDHLELADPKWIAAVVRCEVRRRLSAWPNRRIGELEEKDLVQHIFVFLFDKNRAALKRFDRSLGNPIAYLRDFARKRMIELERKQLRRGDLIKPQFADPGPVETADNPEKWFDYHEKQNRLIEYLKSEAAPEDLDIFHLAFVLGLSNHEIAERREIPVESVANRKFALRKRVRAFLERLGEQRGSR